MIFVFSREEYFLFSKVSSYFLKRDPSGSGITHIVVALKVSGRSKKIF